MLTTFLSDEHSRRYGHFHSLPSQEQLERHFHLDERDQRFLQRRIRGTQNRLGCALQLCTARFLGTFLIDPLAVPPVVIAFLAAQLGVGEGRLFPFSDTRARQRLLALCVRTRTAYRGVHAFRHYAGVRLSRQSGGDVQAVMSMLGHAGPAQSLIYAKLAEEPALKEAVAGW